MSKFAKIVVAISVVIVLGLGMVLFTDFEAPRLGQALIRLASEASGIDIEAERFAFNLRKGLVLEGVVARSEANGETLEATFDQLILEHRLGPLLRGDVVIERVVLEQPRIVMVSPDPSALPEPAEEPAPAEASTPAEEPEGSDEGLYLEVGEIRIVDGYFESRTEGERGGTTIFRGLDLELGDIVTDPQAASAIVGISGRGRIEIEAIEIDDKTIADVRAEVEVDRGRYTLGSFEADAPAGRLEVSGLEIDLAQNPYRYRLEVRVDPFDLNQVVGVSDAFGPVAMELRANGEGPGIVGVVAEMSLDMEEGRLPSVPLLHKVDALLGTTLDSAAYAPLQSSMSLADGLLEVEPIEFVTEIAKLRIHGSIDFEEHIDLKVEVGIPRDLFSREEEISDDVLDALTSRDWLVVPLAVTGEFGDPRFGPDMEVIGEMVRRGASQAKDALMEKARSQLSGAIRRWTE